MQASPRDYIDKLTTSRIPFYDNRSGKMKVKQRPILVIGVEKDSFPCDFNVLPVSTISNYHHRDVQFDYEIGKEKCDQMSLKWSPSFIRVHKQSTCYSRDVDRRYFCDLSKDHSDLYREIVDLHQQFNETLF